MPEAPRNPDRERLRLPGARRITRSAEIRALFQRGKRSRTAHLDVFDSASPAPHPRVGVVVPRHRHTVVARNRVKRRLREALRSEVMPQLDQLPAPIDVLVRARAEAYGVTFAELRIELLEWLARRYPRA